ncbi:MAG: ATP synthase F1 subunit epsilon [bacterium]|nr:ATP synthase F1 subunit epsilon [bacterium]
MPKLFTLEIITPLGTFFKDEILHVRAPGVDGDFGVLADHAPLMAGLRPGRLRVEDPDESFDFVMTGGFFEVHSNRAVVLAETCLRKEDVDLERAIRARDRALQALAEAKTPEAQEEARANLAKVMALIKFIEE